VTGATGFIGQRLVAALAAAGHDVVAAAREPSAAPARPRVTHVHADFAVDLDAATWLPRLAGMEVAINAVGILRETRRQRFAAIHTRAPIALFDACVAAGVRRVIQISALGADDAAVGGYFASKRAADRELARLPLEHIVVQPSLVYGRGGRSAALFETLASAPLVALPGGGHQRVQPVHVDDVVAGLVALVEARGLPASPMPFAGTTPVALREFLVRLRAALGLGRAAVLPIPLVLMRLAAGAGTITGRGLLDRDTLAMLNRGNVGDAAPLARLLGRPARPIEAFVESGDRESAARVALLRWLLPVVRISLAFLWIASGIVSFGLYPVDASKRLLAAVGVTAEPFAALLLYGAAALDVALGVATLVLERRRWLWLAQIAVVLAYTAIISVRLPEQWLEPFGPITKNVPLLAILWLLYELDGRRWNT
jgi:uncharacterized protein YbjT (DUF2867 family)/uncharacterized membrane protein YphA (DoxX/SURF4 family)